MYKKGFLSTRSSQFTGKKLCIHFSPVIVKPWVCVQLDDRTRDLQLCSLIPQAIRYRYAWKEVTLETECVSAPEKPGWWRQNRTLRAEATFSRYEMASEKLLFVRHLIPRKCSLCSQGTKIGTHLERLRMICNPALFWLPLRYSSMIT